MKYTVAIPLSLTLFLLGACAMFETKQTAQPSEPPKPLSVPVGKNWQVIEEAPKLTNERHERLPFQTEESVQPEGAKSASPEEKRKVETPR